VKNKKMPWQISINNYSKFIFDCPDCKHEFEGILNYINRRNNWCHYCSNQKLCEDTSLETGCQWCRSKTFILCDKSQYWSIKNEKLPEQVFISSGIKYKFDCPVCHHVFESNLGNIIKG